MPTKIINGVLLNIIKDHKIYDITYDVNAEKLPATTPTADPTAASWSAGLTVYNYDYQDFSDLDSLPYGGLGEFLISYGTGEIFEEYDSNSNGNGTGDLLGEPDSNGAVGLFYKYTNISTGVVTRRALVNYSANIIPGSFEVALFGNGTLTAGGGNHNNYKLFTLGNMSMCYIRYKAEDPVTGEVSYRYTSTSLSGYFVVSANSSVSTPELQLSGDELITEIKTEKEVQ